MLETLCIYDYCDVNASIVLLSTELGFRSKLTDALARLTQHSGISSQPLYLGRLAGEATSLVHLWALQTRQELTVLMR